MQRMEIEELKKERDRLKEGCKKIPQVCNYSKLNDKHSCYTSKRNECIKNILNPVHPYLCEICPIEKEVEADGKSMD